MLFMRVRPPIRNLIGREFANHRTVLHSINGSKAHTRPMSALGGMRTLAMVAIETLGMMTSWAVERPTRPAEGTAAKSKMVCSQRNQTPTVIGLLPVAIDGLGR
jgi:hypothetical protein